MARVPAEFRKSSDNIIGTFDSTDLITGKGQILFDAFGATQSGSAIVRRIAPSQLYYTEPDYFSGTVTVNQDNMTLTDTVTIDGDTFARPQIMQGKAYLSITYFVTGTSTSGNSFLRITLQKYNTATGSAIDLDYAETPQVGSTFDSKHALVDFDIANTSFSANENIRLKIEVYATRTGGAGNAFGGFFHDPINRDKTVPISATASAKPTYLKLFLPFKVNL